ncbi:type II toxin-antitoxin system VapC family toxin [Candidatus Daviesbacteria bacterium]|nr:type II toxin-antitoxin system VapC family toxin [Candidatus Daviesbacteria bacterium]
MAAKTIVIGDADSLIALFLDYDVNHKRATSTLAKLDQTGITTIYPNTAIAEAITTLLRKHSNPKLAEYLAQQYKDERFTVEYIDEKIMKLATEVFNPKGSKQNTFFDAVVAATAKKLNADAIFSFDEWYTKLGFKLASGVV